MDCWEARHEQEFIKGRADNLTPKLVQPEPVRKTITDVESVAPSSSVPRGKFDIDL
jgi:hypothetical protein